MFSVAVALIALLTWGAASEPQESPSDTARDVTAVIKEFQGALARKDRPALERVLAPEFTSIDRQGTVRNRAAWIDAVAAGRLNTQKVADPEQLSEHFVAFGTAAAARTTVSRYRDLERRRDICTMTRAIYVRSDGGWRAISQQETQLHDGELIDATYDAAIGKYELPNGRSFVVTKVGRTLFGELPIPGFGKVPLFETPNGGLVGPGGEFLYTLEKDPDGRVRTVTMTRYGAEVWRAKRVD